MNTAFLSHKFFTKFSLATSLIIIKTLLDICFLKFLSQLVKLSVDYICYVEFYSVCSVSIVCDRFCDVFSTDTSINDYGFNISYIYFSKIITFSCTFECTAFVSYFVKWSPPFKFTCHDS